MTPWSAINAKLALFDDDAVARRRVKHEDVIARGRVLQLNFQNGWFSDSRYYRSASPGSSCEERRRFGSAVDRCGAFFHADCAQDELLVTIPTGEEVDWSEIEFFCEDCSELGDVV